MIETGIIVGIIIFVVVVLIALIAVIIVVLRKLHSGGNQESPEAVERSERDRSLYEQSRPIASPVFSSPLTPSYSNPSSPRLLPGQDYPTYKADNNSAFGGRNQSRPLPGISRPEPSPSRSEDPDYNIIPSPRPVPRQHCSHVGAADPREPDYDALPSPRPAPRQHYPSTRRPATSCDSDYNNPPSGHNHSEPLRPKDSKDPDYDILPSPRPLTSLDHSNRSTSKDPDYDILPRPRPLTGQSHSDPSGSPAKSMDPDYDRLPVPRPVACFDNLSPVQEEGLEDSGIDSGLPSSRPAVVARHPGLKECPSSSQPSFKSRFAADGKHSSQKATAEVGNKSYDDSNDDPVNDNDDDRRPIWGSPAGGKYDQCDDESYYEAIYHNNR